MKNYDWLIKRLWFRKFEFIFLICILITGVYNLTITFSMPLIFERVTRINPSLIWTVPIGVAFGWALWAMYIQKAQEICYKLKVLHEGFQDAV